MVNKVNGLLGICSKAGKIVVGTDAVIEGINKNLITAVIVAEDTSENTTQKIEKICKEKNVKMFIYGNIFENSRAIGKVNKAVIGIKDKNLGLSLEKQICGGEVE